MLSWSVIGKFTGLEDLSPKIKKLNNCSTASNSTVTLLLQFWFAGLVAQCLLGRGVQKVCPELSSFGKWGYGEVVGVYSR